MVVHSMLNNKHSKACTRKASVASATILKRIYKLSILVFLDGTLMQSFAKIGQTFFMNAEPTDRWLYKTPNVPFNWISLHLIKESNTVYIFVTNYLKVRILWAESTEETNSLDLIKKLSLKKGNMTISIV